LAGYPARSRALKEEVRLWVAKEIGSLAKPDDIRFTEALPKTRSAKIMRRLLKEIAAGGEVKGDTTTLEDLSVIANRATSKFRSWQPLPEVLDRHQAPVPAIQPDPAVVAALAGRAAHSEDGYHALPAKC
jgi:hypothetical protein